MPGGEVSSRRLPEGVGRVLVLGASRSGQAAAGALVEAGRPVVLSDSLPLDQLLLDGGVKALLPRVELLAGRQDDGQLAGVDLIVKSPGVPGEIPLLVAARSRGIPVWSELELAYRLLPNAFSAVTGTNGKTTTTALLGHIFAVAGRPARVLGNIGTPVTSAVGHLVPDEEVVVEVSSFQLEDVHAFRPTAAVFLNLTEDHLDRHFTLERYLACKAKLFACQGAGDAAVINVDDPAGGAIAEVLKARGEGPELRLFSPRGRTKGVFAWLEGSLLRFDQELSFAVRELGLRGMHNYENCLAAGTAALSRGVSAAAVAEGLATFAGVPHRLQPAGTLNGVAYVNDSKATNVEAALKALDAYPEGTHLILGGKDKASDYRPLARACRGRCAAVYLIGSAAPLIAAAFDEVGRETGGRGPEALPPLQDCGDMERAVRAAGQMAKPGEVILLAPACASFDQYRNFEERGEHFMELARLLGAT